MKAYFGRKMPDIEVLTSYISNVSFNVFMGVKYIHASGHADRRGIKKMIACNDPKRAVCIHSEDSR